MLCVNSANSNGLFAFKITAWFGFQINMDLHLLVFKDLICQWCCDHWITLASFKPFPVMPWTLSFPLCLKELAQVQQKLACFSMGVAPSLSDTGKSSSDLKAQSRFLFGTIKGSLLHNSARIAIMFGLEITVCFDCVHMQGLVLLNHALDIYRKCAISDKQDEVSIILRWLTVTVNKSENKTDLCREQCINGSMFIDTGILWISKVVCSGWFIWSTTCVVKTFKLQSKWFYKSICNTPLGWMEVCCIWAHIFIHLPACRSQSVYGAQVWFGFQRS